MTASYRLRVEVPLETVAPRAAADVIDALGGDVVAVDLREVDGQGVIDEMVVEFPRDPDIPTLNRVLDDVPAVTLLSSQRCELEQPNAQRWNRAHRTKRTRGSEIAAGGGLSSRVSVACPLSTVSICPADHARALPAVQMALARGGPVAHRCTGLPEQSSSSRERRPAWLLAVADRYPHASTVALVTRPVSLRFSAHEVNRVQVLMGSQAS